MQNHKATVAGQVAGLTFSAFSNVAVSCHRLHICRARLIEDVLPVSVAPATHGQSPDRAARATADCLFPEFYVTERSILWDV